MALLRIWYFREGVAICVSAVVAFYGLQAVYVPSYTINRMMHTYPSVHCTHAHACTGWMDNMRCVVIIYYLRILYMLIARLFAFIRSSLVRKHIYIHATPVTLCQGWQSGSSIHTCIHTHRHVQHDIFS